MPCDITKGRDPKPECFNTWFLRAGENKAGMESKGRAGWRQAQLAKKKKWGEANSV